MQLSLQTSQPLFYVVGEGRPQTLDGHVPQCGDDAPFPTCKHCKQIEQP